MFAAGLWGFGFIAVVWSLEELGPLQITFSRFLIGAFIGIVVQIPFRSRIEWKSAISLGFWIGFFLAGTLVLQTTGLQYTSATKSGFITTLYVVMVPLFEAVYYRHKISLKLWGLVFLALLGTALIMRFEFTDLNKGDLMTLACAVLASLHIIWIGKVSAKSRHPFLLNTAQSLWAAIILLPFVEMAPWWDKMTSIASWSPKAIFGLFALGVGSTTLAFYLQVKAQAHLSPTVSSLLFLLESPLAMIFAFFLLGESLSLMEGSGALLIFAAAVLASLQESKRNESDQYLASTKTLASQNSKE